MRTTTTAEDHALQLEERTTHARVLIDNSSGSPIDITDLAGRNWLISFRVNRSIDDPVPTAELVLGQRDDGWNMSSLMSSSPISDLCELGHDVVIQVQVTGAGVEADPSAWQAIFFGQIDEMSWTGETVTLTCADDIMRDLRDTFAAAELTYGSTGGVAAETVIQDILDDNGLSAITLQTPTSPSWSISPAFFLEKQSVLDGVRLIAGMIGWDVVSRWLNSASGWRLVFEAPDRTKSTPDLTLGPGLYEMTRRISLGMSEIRNKVIVWYPNGSNLDYQGRQQMATVNNSHMASAVQTIASNSQSEYGIKLMEIVYESSSAIDSQAEAIDLAEAAIYDLAEPTMDMEVQIPFWWPLQIRDLLEFEADNINFDSDQQLAVDALEHVFEAGSAYTSVVVSGKPKLGRRRWLQREARPGLGRPLPDGTPAAPSVTATARVAALQLDLGTLPGRGWEEAEIHVSTSSGFTPSSSTLRYHGKASLVTMGLDPNTLYYIKARFRDRFGNWSDYSTQTSGTPQMPNEVSCRAIQTSTQTDGTSGATLDWGSVTENPSGGSNFNTSSDYFQAPRDGLYAMTLQVTQAGSGETSNLYAAFEDDAVTGSPTTYAGGEGPVRNRGAGDVYTFTTILALDEGDQVFANLYWGGGAGLETSGDSATQWVITRMMTDLGRT